VLHALPLLIIALCVAVTIIADSWPLISAFLSLGVVGPTVLKSATRWITIIFPVITFCLCWYVILSRKYDAWAVSGAFVVIGYLVRGWLPQPTRIKRTPP
jgi:hypothetical protein